MTPPPSAMSSGSVRPAPSRPGLDPPGNCSSRSWRAKLRVRPFLLAVIVAAFVTTGAAVTASHLTRNSTPSLPLGVYWLRPGLLPIKGEIVDLAIPSSARDLIVGRYLPVGFRLLKRVVAVQGDHVCLSHRQYRVNGVNISKIAPVDSVGRALPVFSFCGDVPEGMAFVATAVPSSLDSRYFGPVPIDALTVARPLWTF
jgi:conjugative transfer signal peptidase TraF